VVPERAHLTTLSDCDASLCLLLGASLAIIEQLGFTLLVLESSDILVLKKYYVAKVCCIFPSLFPNTILHYGSKSLLSPKTMHKVIPYGFI
jgi:hypothetical protein